FPRPRRDPPPRRVGRGRQRRGAGLCLWRSRRSGRAAAPRNHREPAFRSPKFARRVRGYEETMAQPSADEPRELRCDELSKNKVLEKSIAPYTSPRPNKSREFCDERLGIGLK